MNKFLSDIKNGDIANVYLFCGEDAYKRRVCRNSLKSALYSNDMNYSYFEGESIDWQRVYDACTAVPFFAARRLVIVENCGKFRGKAADGADKEILSVLEALPGQTCLAFSEEEALKSKKIYKEIAKKGEVVACGHDDEQTAAAWLRKGFAQAGKKVNSDALYYIIGCAGVDYERLKTEYEKVIAYAADSDAITKADAQAVVTQDVDAKVFDMLTACGEKNAPLMLEKYYGLVANEVFPLIILANMRNQFKLMLQIGELSGRGLSDRETGARLKKADFIIKKNKRLLRNFTLGEIEQILDDIARTDKSIKDGDIDAAVGVELVLIGAAGGAGR